MRSVGHSILKFSSRRLKSGLKDLRGPNKSHYRRFLHSPFMMIRGQRSSCERILLPQTKNGDGRTVWLNTLACDVIDSLECGEPTQRVFSADIQPENVSLAFLRACRRVKIVDFRLHGLRHTAASWLRMSGADLQDVADLLGHRDPADDPALC